MKEYIEALQEAFDGEYRPEALRAAIALMRASEPKDEAAEDTHCDQVACAFWDLRNSDEIRHMPCLAQLIMRERTAARAEVEAKYASMLSPKNEAAEREHCRVWCHEHEMTERESDVEDLMRERAAARAEVVMPQAETINNLRAENERLKNDYAALAAKLSNFRTDIRVALRDAEAQEKP